MDDHEIFDRIQTLVDEEHKVRAHETPGDEARISRLEEMLDQCWDLLRQRRARREFGDDPDAASVRDITIVENYRQ